MSLTKRLYEHRKSISMCICLKNKDGSCLPCTRECQYCFDESVEMFDYEEFPDGTLSRSLDQP